MLLPGDIDLNADEVIEEHVYHGTVKVRLATKNHFKDYYQDKYIDNSQ